MDKQQKTEKSVLSVVDHIHNLSLRVLTLCGFGALLSLGVNLVTALVMFLLQRKEK